MASTLTSALYPSKKKLVLIGIISFQDFSFIDTWKKTRKEKRAGISKFDLKFIKIFPFFQKQMIRLISFQTIEKVCVNNQPYFSAAWLKLCENRQFQVDNRNSHVEWQAIISITQTFMYAYIYIHKTDGKNVFCFQKKNQWVSSRVFRDVVQFEMN